MTISRISSFNITVMDNVQFSNQEDWFDFIYDNAYISMSEYMVPRTDAAAVLDQLDKESVVQTMRRYINYNRSSILVTSSLPYDFYCQYIVEHHKLNISKQSPFFKNHHRFIFDEIFSMIQQYVKDKNKYENISFSQLIDLYFMSLHKDSMVRIVRNKWKIKGLLDYYNHG